jgi:tetratricopeptide (TPR) repeat protein
VFALVALVAWPMADERHADLRRGGAAMSMLLALFCKEVAFAVPLAVIACELSRKLPARETATRVAWPAAAAALYLAIRTAALASAAAPHDRPNPHPLATPFEALGTYVQMILDPWQPRAPIGMRGEPSTLFVAIGGVAAIAAATGAIAVAIAVRKGRLRLAPPTVLWAAIAIFALAPTLQVLPIRLGGAVVADRFLYLPLAAVAILVAQSFTVASAQRDNVAFVLSAALLVSLVPVAHARAGVFGDELTLWTTLASEAHPHNTMPRGNLAALPAMSERPDLKLAITARVSRVLEATDRVASPTYRRARSNEIAALVANGKYDDAVASARALMTQFPDSAVVQAELGYAELHVGDLTEAAEAFERAYTLDPTFDDARRMGTVATELARGGYRKTMTDVSPQVLGVLGRRIEACAGYRALVRDPRVAPERRLDALDALVRYDDVREARKSFAVLAADLLAQASGGDESAFQRADATLAAREASRARVDRLAPEVEALLARPL